MGAVRARRCVLLLFSQRLNHRKQAKQAWFTPRRHVRLERMNRYAICVAAVLLIPLAASAESYRMMVNHGVGWTPIGDYATLNECELEARTYAAKNSAQAGCAPLSALQQYEAERQSALQFQSAARACAARSQVQIVVKPGERLTTYGTERQRFEFDKCMAGKGQNLE